jgi:long-chain-fatty-acid--CoA ligase ACSBG
LKQTIGTWAKKTGLEYNRNLVNGNTNSSYLSYMIANKVVFQKIKTALGFNKCLRFFVSAAPITIETLEYFMSVDIRFVT